MRRVIVLGALVGDGALSLAVAAYQQWGQTLLDKIKGLTAKPVTTIINTHTHGTG